MHVICWLFHWSNKRCWPGWVSSGDCKRKPTFLLFCFWCPWSVFALGPDSQLWCITHWLTISLWKDIQTVCSLGMNIHEKIYHGKNFFLWNTFPKTHMLNCVVKCIFSFNGFVRLPLLALEMMAFYISTSYLWTTPLFLILSNIWYYYLQV